MDVFHWARGAWPCWEPLHTCVDCASEASEACGIEEEQFRAAIVRGSTVATLHPLYACTERK